MSLRPMTPTRLFSIHQNPMDMDLPNPSKSLLSVFGAEKLTCSTSLCFCIETCMWQRGQHLRKHMVDNHQTTWSTIIKNRGRTSSKHMVNNRQQTLSSIVKNMVEHRLNTLSIIIERSQQSSKRMVAHINLQPPIVILIYLTLLLCKYPL
jgi:hypothetical protein